MSKDIKGNNKHLSLDDRITIEQSLKEGRSFRQIALELFKDPSTISKEVKLHRVLFKHSRFNSDDNDCNLRFTCNRKGVCTNLPYRCDHKLCRSCSLCNRTCPDFTPTCYDCPQTLKAPFVCNGCKKKTHCRFDRFTYTALIADKQYHSLLIDSRTGIDMTHERLLEIDTVISPLVKQGQSPYLIHEAHPGLGISIKTMYNYINNGSLSVKDLDLYKKVKYKPRNSHNDYPIKDTGIFIGRMYSDYLEYMENYPETSVVEMDTVVGCEGSHKAILTLYFRSCHLQLLYLLPEKTTLFVKERFDQLEKRLSTLEFSHVFPLILTDRGTEFSDPASLESGTSGIIRTSIYFCNPMRSVQKSGCEKNHEFIRKVLPKGSSFDNLTQFDIDRLSWHINSTKRASLNGMTPFRLASLLLNEQVIKAFNLREIAPNQVLLTPELLKK